MNSDKNGNHYLIRWACVMIAAMLIVVGIMSRYDSWAISMILVGFGVLLLWLVLLSL